MFCHHDISVTTILEVSSTNLVILASDNGEALPLLYDSQ